MTQHHPSAGTAALELPKPSLVSGLLSPGNVDILLERTDEGFALIDMLTGTYIYVSESGQQLLGMDEDPVGQRAPWMTTKPGSTMHQKVAGREFSYRCSHVSSAALNAAAIQFRDVTAERRRERQLRAFSVAAASAAFADSLAATLNTLAEQVRRAARMGSCTFLLYDRDGALHLSGTAGPYPRSSDYTERLSRCRALGAPLLSDQVVKSKRMRVETGWRQRTLLDTRFSPIHEISKTAGWETIVVVPLLVRGTVVGVFNGFYPLGGAPDADDLAFLNSIADHAAVAVDTFHAHAELEHEIAHTERVRLARDLHDTVSQLLFAVTTHAAALEREAAGRPDAANLEAHIRQLRSLSSDAFEGMRTLLDGIRGLGERGSLLDGIRMQLDLARALGCDSELEESSPLPTLRPLVEEQVLRVLQEAINNVSRHAPGARILVTSGSDHDGLRFSVSDNGPGFIPDAANLRRFGLDGMRDRMRSIGGKLTIDTSARGTTVEVHVPQASLQ